MDKILDKWVRLSGGAMLLGISFSQAFAVTISEPVEACVMTYSPHLSPLQREQIAQCLGWSAKPGSFCLGSYKALEIKPLNSDDEVRILADKASFYQNKPSMLQGQVEIQQQERIVSAKTAYVHRDAKSNKINRIEFLGEVRYLEPDKLMIAREAYINPQTKEGAVQDVYYRFYVDKKGALLPAWGRSSKVERFANADYLLKNASYTTCAPQDKAWDLQARSIAIDDKNKVAVARDVTVRVREWPIFYAPYLSFPTSKERKSGFLMPIAGYSNVSGFDVGTPYYWNIAPNYDLTITPHAYSERGVMLGGDFRFLSANSQGVISGNFMPNDAKYRRFLHDNAFLYPQFRDDSTNRWSLGILEQTRFTPNLILRLNAQQVSDDYYFQSFSTNLALVTQRQLLRQADLTYTTDHWLVRGMVQGYQTLHPVNETPIADQYQRMPQLLVDGYYDELLGQTNLNIFGQYDQFAWPGNPWNGAQVGKPQGPRLHFNPKLSLPLLRSWGYVTPMVEVVENYYEVSSQVGPYRSDFNRFIPRYSVKSGLVFERQKAQHLQTLEPNLFYLYVPYQNQAEIPIYDTANMIFNVDQLFRTNRFSGFDRIGDANQLSYSLTSRWLSASTGREWANFSVGQIKYFRDRKVQLCRRLDDSSCVASPYEIGQLSPFYGLSPIASRGIYHLNSSWQVFGDYVWDPATSATNNAGLKFQYQPYANTVFNVGYSYLVNGDITFVRNNWRQNNALHQAIGSMAFPLNDRWITFAAYSHNISKDYSMLSLLGLQYDSCCWAVRILGGRTFKNLTGSYEPQYNNNVYLQVLFKGLGSVGNSDPSSILHTYIPGYNDAFHH